MIEIIGYGKWDLLINQKEDLEHAVEDFHDELFCPCCLNTSLQETHRFKEPVYDEGGSLAEQPESNYQCVVCNYEYRCVWVPLEN